MDLMLKQGWTSTGTSGALSAIEAPAGMAYATFYVDCSTLTTTQSISLQAAQASSGPWFIEASTQIAVNISTAFGMHITSPVGPFVRPYLHSPGTGFYNILLVGVG